MNTSGLNFNPNDACEPNDRFFGFPFSTDNAPLVLIPVPWDVTTSYHAGTSHGPEAILKASYQLDFYDPQIPEAWKLGISSLDINEWLNVKRTSSQLGLLKASEEEEDVTRINEASAFLNEWVEDTARPFLEKGQRVGIVGGDHSTPYGLIKLLGKYHESFGILHIDAHADLRKAYEGYEFSHASIMYQASLLPAVSRIVQLGIRDYCEDEAGYAARQGERICQFCDLDLQKRLAEGDTWKQIVEEVIDALPEKVYISFDIDGLEPGCCYHTGTPVPGGLSFSQAQYLLLKIRESKKKIIGFDLCEVAPNLNDPNDELDGNIGARILYLLSNTLLIS